MTTSNLFWIVNDYSLKRAVGVGFLQIVGKLTPFPSLFWEKDFNERFLKSSLDLVNPDMDLCVMISWNSYHVSLQPIKNYWSLLFLSNYFYDLVTKLKSYLPQCVSNFEWRQGVRTK